MTSCIFSSVLLFDKSTNNECCLQTCIELRPLINCRSCRVLILYCSIIREYCRRNLQSTSISKYSLHEATPHLHKAFSSTSKLTGYYTQHCINISTSYRAYTIAMYLIYVILSERLSFLQSRSSPSKPADHDLVSR